MDRDQAGQRIRELGERLGIADLALDDGNTARLAIQDGPTVNVGYAAASGTLELMICLDAIAVTPSIMNDVLGANFAWRRSGGGAFAIDEASQALVLQRRCTDAEAVDGGLFAALEALVAAAEAWQRRIMGVDGDPPGGQATGATVIPNGMVRA